MSHSNVPRIITGSADKNTIKPQNVLRFGATIFISTVLVATTFEKVDKFKKCIENHPKTTSWTCLIYGYCILIASIKFQ